MSVVLIQGDARHLPLQVQAVQCVVTSPPYWGLRDYGLSPLVWDDPGGCEHVWGDDQGCATGRLDYGTHTSSRLGGNTGGAVAPGPTWASRGSWCQDCSAWRGSLGLEPTPVLYVQHLVAIFREVRRVLRDDGTVWLNLGDCYHSGNRGRSDGNRSGVKKNMGSTASDFRVAPHRMPQPGLKDKDLVGIPWRVALALQADGWWLRSDIIWSKPNQIPESVTDRPTKSHEYLFLLSKAAHYYYDAAAIREPMKPITFRRVSGSRVLNELGGPKDHLSHRNRRSVWTIVTQSFGGLHFATFPEQLVEPCVLAGSAPGDVVLDPFGGSGTVGVVAHRLGRRGILVELKADYVLLAHKRLGS